MTLASRTPLSRKMLTALITANRGAGTVGPTIGAFLRQLRPASERIVDGPDPETTAVVRGYAEQHAAVRHVRDPQQGKPTAIDLGLGAARGEILALSDGDVYVAEDALAPSIAPFDDPAVGAVTGRPVGARLCDTILEYWPRLLTEAGRVRESGRRCRRCGRSPAPQP